MTYKNLPPVGHLTLPDLGWVPGAHSSRHGSPIEVVFLHRWGVSDWRHERINGVVGFFTNPANQASAHIVYAGERGADKGRCVQMVAYKDKAWTEAHDNPRGISIECGDGIWLGQDPEGFARTARITGYLLHKFGLPAVWNKTPHHGKGFARHADGGTADGGHTSCPTTDLELWRQFARRVKAEVKHGGYRPVWGR